MPIPFSGVSKIVSQQTPVTDDVCRSTSTSGTKTSKTSDLSNGEHPIHTRDNAFESPANLTYLKKLYCEYLNGTPLLHHDLIRE